MPKDEDPYSLPSDALPPKRPEKSPKIEAMQKALAELSKLADSSVRISSVNEEDLYSLPQASLATGAPVRPSAPKPFHLQASKDQASQSLSEIAKSPYLEPVVRDIDVDAGESVVDEEIYVAMEDINRRGGKLSEMSSDQKLAPAWRGPQISGSSSIPTYEIPVKRSPSQEPSIELFNEAMAEIEGARGEIKDLKFGKASNSPEAKRADTLGRIALAHFSEAIAEIFKNQSLDDIKLARDVEGNSLFDKMADAAIRHCSDTPPQPAITGLDEMLRRFVEEMFDKNMPLSESKEAKLDKAGIKPEAPERGGKGDRDSGFFSQYSVSSEKSEDSKPALGSATQAVLAARAAASTSKGGGRFS